MLDILFCYAKEVPNVGYRQGMHELVAPILFVLHAESREDIHTDDSLRYTTVHLYTCIMLFILYMYCIVLH